MLSSRHRGQATEQPFVPPPDPRTLYMRRTPYLSAIGSFRLKVIQGDQLPEQAALLVAPLHSSQLEVSLRSLEDQPEVDSKACHVDSEGPVWVEHGFPAVDLPRSVHFGRLVAQATDEGHWPHRHLPGAAHLQARKEKGWKGARSLQGPSSTPAACLRLARCPAGAGFWERCSKEPGHSPRHLLWFGNRALCSAHVYEAARPVAGGAECFGIVAAGDHV